MKKIIMFPAASDRVQGGVRLALCLVAFLFCWVAPTVVECRPWTPGRLSRMSAAFDFKLRYHEAECLRLGHDPFRVWNGDVPMAGYVPYDIKDISTNLERAWREGGKMLHVYPPWAMVLFVPLTCLSEALAFDLYTGAEILLVALLMLLLKRRVESRFGDERFGVLAVAFGGFAMPAIMNCLHLGNFGIFIAFSVVTALLLIERRRPYLAGLPLFVTMLKPQIGILYVLMLLMLGKWKPVAVAALVALALSAVASFLCGSSVVGMILSIKDYNGAACFPSTGFVSPVLHGWLHARSPALPLAVGIGFCGLLCAALTRMFAASKDLLVSFLPAILISTVWAAGGWLHDHSIDAVGYVLLTYVMFLYRRSPFALAAAMAVLLFAMMREIGKTPYPVPNIAVALMMAGLFGLGFCMRSKEMKTDGIG